VRALTDSKPLLLQLRQVHAFPHRDDPLVEAALKRLIAQVQSAHPEWTLDLPDLVGYLAARLPAGKNPLESLERLQTGDLVLAWACLAALPSALALLDGLVRHVVAAVRPRGSRDAADDLAQDLHQRLLVPAEGQQPKLAQYTGRGPLVSWLRVVAARTAINSERASKREVAEADLEERAISAPNPELQFIRAQYRQPFKQAFRAALTDLAPAQRTLLRLHFVEGVSHQQIARMDRVHQTTVTRRIAAAQSALLENVHQCVRKHLHLNPGEIDSLVRAVGSALDVSLISVLSKS
jgi:RNA polymerase sigma-70 factor, ECF subfamily